MAEQRCHACGAVRSHKEFRSHGLFCGKTCEDKFTVQTDEVVDSLKAAGFEQHPTVPNLMIKGGVSVSKEQVHRGNLEEIIRQHAAIASARA